MKVKIKSIQQIVEAKRFKDFTPEEINASTRYPELWDGDEIFIASESTSEDHEYCYVVDEEVEVLEE